MSNIEQSIDVNVPVSTAYSRWTQCEAFPRFMEGVVEVRQLENAGDAVGGVRARIRGDLDRSENFVEQRDRETGACRGSINAPHS